MKKILIALFACGLAALALAQTVLSTSSQSTTITTDVIIEEGRWRKQSDGTVKLYVVPVVVKSDAAGKEISRGYSPDSFEITLTPSQFSGISALLKAAYEAKLAAQASTP